jgi:hypothetical protein
VLGILLGKFSAQKSRTSIFSNSTFHVKSKSREVFAYLTENLNLSIPFEKLREDPGFIFVKTLFSANGGNSLKIR